MPRRGSTEPVERPPHRSSPRLWSRPSTGLGWPPMVSIGRSVADLASLVGGEVLGSGRTLVSGITHDSRQAGPGVLFVAIEGATADGHSFVPDAVAAGSPAVCVEHPTDSGVVEILVANTRASLGPLAAAVYDYPSRTMDIVGV
ncbi:MAG TPA: hypothetical protein EYP73_04760, partial [Acidimicrobiia bacterium]|nr:hypothetical protein [Acidimicrobiia bacterium]